MTDGVTLGSASLTLGADLVPLRADLDDAKARVAASVEEMQALLDRLHVGAHGGLLATSIAAPFAAHQESLGLWAAAQDAALADVRKSIKETDAAYVGLGTSAQLAADVQVAATGRVIEAYAAQAAAAKAAADVEEAAAARAAAARGLLGGIGGRGVGVPLQDTSSRTFLAGRAGSETTEVFSGRSGIWGVRGPVAPGSIANPITTVQEAGARTPLGALAAAIGEDAQGGGPEAVTATTERGGQRTVIAATPAEQQAPQEQAVPVVAGFDQQRQQVMEGSLARAIGDLEAAQRPSSAGKTTIVAGITEDDRKTAQATGLAIADALAAEAAAKALPANLGPGQIAKGGSAYRAAYEALGYTVASRVAGGPPRLYAPGGEPGTSNYGLTAEAALLAAQKASDAKAEADLLAVVLGEPYGAGALGVAGLGPRSALSALGLDMTRVQEALYEPEKAAASAAGATGAPGGSGGGGGVPPWLTALLWGHAGGGGGGGGGYSGAGGGVLFHLLFAGAGLGAGIGSLGSFAGFGPEHIVLTLGGIAGSGVAALGGGALLGAGALGKLGAGFGSDLAVSSSAIADTSTLYKAVEKLREAEQRYGKASKQAAEAREELNAAMKYELGGTKGVEAELRLAERVSTLNKTWDQETSSARVAFVKLVEPLVEIATKWIPLINTAAEQNFTQTAKYIKPFFEYLKGPEAMGIFLQLESEFKNEIPTAMKALDEGFQFFAKTIAYTAPLTGGFLRDLDRFFTKWNTPSEFSVWEDEMNKLITDFHVWGAFIKILGDDLVDLFDKDAHTGEGIIETLTAMLDKVHEYENSVKGSEAIRNIFLVHKEEVIALLKILPGLISGFSEIYTAIAPDLVPVVTLLANAFANLVNTLNKLGPLGEWAVGLTVIAAKLKILVPLVKAAGIETGILAGAEDKAAASGGLDAAAQGGLAATEGVVGVGAATSAGGLILPAGVEAPAAEGAGLAGLLTKSNLLKAGIYGVGGLIAGSLTASAVGAKGTLASSLQAGGAGAGAGFVLGPAAGALIGTEITPVIGTALGAAIGFSAPYVIKAMKDVFSTGTEQAVTEAQRQAKRYLEGGRGLLGPAEDQHYNAALSKALANPAIVTAREAERFKGTTGESSAEQASLDAAAKGAYAKAGAIAGKAFVETFQHVETPTRLGFLVTMTQRLEELPKQLLPEAAKAMLEYAAQLEASGALPKHAVEGLVTYLQHKFGEIVLPGMPAKIAKAFELTGAKKVTEEGLSAIERRWGASFANTQKGQIEAIHFLQQSIRNNTGPTAEAFRQMLSQVTPTFEKVWKLAAEVNAEGIAAVNAEINSDLKALGAPEIKSLIGKSTPGGGVSGSPFSSPGRSGEGALAPGAAQGALFQIGSPGAAGHDTYGLNVGGLPIAVGSGEQVAVFNRHQQPIVNAALAAAGYDGLPGLFSAVSTPNYMAAGGLIPAVVSAGLADVRKAGKAKLASVHRRGGVGGGALGGASFSGDWVQVMRGIAKEEGWSLADWEKVIAHESGGRVSVLSGGIGPAFGLGQLEPENYDKYGGGPGSSGVEQIIAMARYIKADYGNPTKAWASEVSRGIYALGGLLPSFARGGLPVPGYDMDEHRQFLKEWVKYEALLLKDKAFGPSGVFPQAPVEWQNPNRVKVYMPNGEEIEGLYQGSATQYGRPRNEPSDGIWNRLRDWAHARNHPAPEAMASGGLLGFAPGGIVPPKVTGHHLQPTSGSGRKVPGNFGHNAKKNPKGAKKAHHYSGPLTLPWNPSENENLYELGTLLETALPAAQEAYGNLTNQFGLVEYGSGNLSFIITEGPLGETITPHEDPTNVQGRLGQLHALFGAEGHYRALLIEAQSNLGQINGWIAAQMAERHKRIKELQERIEKIRAQIEANLKKLAALEKAREDARTKNKSAVRALEGQIETAENAKHPNYPHITALRSQLRVLRGEESASGLEAQIKGLRAENKRLGGDETEIGSHGELGPLEASRDKLQGQLSTLGERRSTLSGDLQGIQGVGGEGGTLAESALTLSQLNKQIGELSPESLGIQLARAVAQVGGGAGGESPLELAERKLVQQEERNKVLQGEVRASTQALGVFSGSGDIGVGGKTAFAAAAARGMLIPASWVPSFDVGGVVGGPIGAPQVAVLHGGEEVLTPEQRERGGIHHHWAISTLHPSDPQTLRAIGNAATRGQRLQGSRPSKRIRPGV